MSESSLVQNSRDESVVLTRRSKGDADVHFLAFLPDLEHLTETRRCPYICQVLDFFQDHTSFSVVNEFSTGGDCEALLSNAKAQGVATSEGWYRNLLKQPFRGLAYVHQLAILHCDIKEQNLVLRTRDFHFPEIAIAGLGLHTSEVIEGGRRVEGTPGYIPPETWTSGIWFPCGDVFSMAVVAMQLLTGRTRSANGQFQSALPLQPGVAEDDPARGLLFFEGCSSAAEAADAVLQRPLPWSELRSLSTGLVDCLRSCLEKSRERRPHAANVLSAPWFTESTTTYGEESPTKKRVSLSPSAPSMMSPSPSPQALPLTARIGSPSAPACAKLLSSAETPSSNGTPAVTPAAPLSVSFRPALRVMPPLA